MNSYQLAQVAFSVVSIVRRCRDLSFLPPFDTLDQSEKDWWLWIIETRKSFQGSSERGFLKAAYPEFDAMPEADKLMMIAAIAAIDVFLANEVK
jgi:hypothetical protein